MSLRPITIPPWRTLTGVSGTATVSLELVDAAGSPIVGLVAPSGEPLAGRESIETTDAEQSISIYPQTDIARAMSDPSAETFYAVLIDTERASWGYRVTIPPGASPLTWAELIEGGDPLEAADLSALQVHLADDAKHLLPDERAALSAAASPSATNPLATVSELVSGSGHTIRDSGGADLPSRTGLRFVGDVTVTDDEGNGETRVDIDGGVAAHEAAPDPHPGYRLESVPIDLSSDVSSRLPLASLAQVSAAARLLGRGADAGAGDAQEIVLGDGLALSGTILSASGGVITGTLELDDDQAGSIPAPKDIFNAFVIATRSDTGAAMNTHTGILAVRAGANYSLYRFAGGTFLYVSTAPPGDGAGPDGYSNVIASEGALWISNRAGLPMSYTYTLL